MSAKYKTYHLRLPIDLHESLIRLFPSSGERARFFRELACRAVESAQHKDGFFDRIEEIVRKENTP